MNRRYIIANMDQFDPVHKDYGVILAEKHPEVKFSLKKPKQTVDKYLWYHYEIGKHPKEFVDYHREKLAITDPNEAQALINLWNREFQDNELKKVKFSDIIPIANINFGIIELPKSDKCIVMMNRAVRIPYQKSKKAGSGGYGWQYLSAGIKPTGEELKNKFNLNEAQQNQFIRNW